MLFNKFTKALKCLQNRGEITMRILLLLVNLGLEKAVSSARSLLISLSPAAGHGEECGVKGGLMRRG